MPSPNGGFDVVRECDGKYNTVENLATRSEAVARAAALKVESDRLQRGLANIPQNRRDRRDD